MSKFTLTHLGSCRDTALRTQEPWKVQWPGATFTCHPRSGWAAEVVQQPQPQRGCCGRPGAASSQEVLGQGSPSLPSNPTSVTPEHPERCKHRTLGFHTGEMGSDSAPDSQGNAWMGKCVRRLHLCLHLGTRHPVSLSPRREPGMLQQGSGDPSRPLGPGQGRPSSADSFHWPHPVLHRSWRSRVLPTPGA